MKKSSGISSVESKAAFRQRLVEKFVQQNLPPFMLNGSRISGMGEFTNRYREIEYCAAETPAIGTVDILYTTRFFHSIKKLSVPVYSRFFVFFTRDDMDDYRVAWSSSLS